MERGNRRFWALFAFLVVGAVLINAWAWVGEAHVSRSELKTFPTRVGEWQQWGSDERFDAATESVLRADDYLSRNYIQPNGQVASFYVGYYATQTKGASYHSPLNCLPGAGWVLGPAATERITPVDGSPSFEVNRYLINKGDQKFILLYWYEGRGRKVASEYWGKVYTVLDSARRRRSDGAMVRVMVPIRQDENSALKAADDLAAQITPTLPPYIPN